MVCYVFYCIANGLFLAVTGKLQCKMTFSIYPCDLSLLYKVHNYVICFCFSVYTACLLDTDLSLVGRICEEFWKFWVDLKVKESCYYCNSPYYIKSQINRLQQIWFAHTVVKAPKFSHIIAIVRSHYWLDINEHIEYELISLTYEVLTTS